MGKTQWNTLSRKACVVLKIENDEPHFGQISRIFVVQNQLLLLVTQLHTIRFSDRYHAVVVSKTSRYMYVWAKDLKDFHVYGKYSIPNIDAYMTTNFIVIKYNLFE